MSIRCVWITAFGMPVEPEVSRNFVTVSGPIAPCAASTVPVSRVAASVREQRRLAARGRRLRHGELGVRRHRRFDRAPVPASVGGEDQPRRHQSNRVRAACRSPARRANTRATPPGTARRRAARRARAWACSRSFSDRISSGRSADSPRSSNAWPRWRARSSACAYVIARQAPSGPRRANSVRSGAAAAYSTRRSVSRAGNGPRASVERSRRWPRASRATSTGARRRATWR